jgi:hypothetical protein
MQIRVVSQKIVVENPDKCERIFRVYLLQSTYLLIYILITVTLCTGQLGLSVEMGEPTL